MGAGQTFKEAEMSKWLWEPVKYYYEDNFQNGGSPGSLVYFQSGSGEGAKKSKNKLRSVSFAFTHTFTLEKLTLLLFPPSVHGKF